MEEGNIKCSGQNERENREKVDRKCEATSRRM